MGNFLSGAIHAVGDVVAPVAKGVGAVTGNGYLSAVGQNIANPNVVYSKPGNANASGFTPAYTPQKVAGYQQNVNGYNTSDPNQQQQQPSGSYTGGTGSSGSGTDYSPNIASLDAQMGSLRGTLGSADTQLQSGIGNINDQFNQQSTDANLQRSRALQDFQTKEQNDNTNHQQAIDQVNTKARTLANSVRQMIGNAGGSGSSAYQIAAPDAVARQANLQSQDINSNFGQNVTGLHTAEDRAKEDFTNFLSKLADTKTKSINSLQTGIEGQKQAINGQLADLAAQRAAYAGGGVSGAAAAAHPYQANVDAAGQAIQNIANSYKSPFGNIAPVTVAQPTLRDYVTGQQQVSADPNSTQGATTPTYNPRASWLKQDDTSNVYAY